MREDFCTLLIPVDDSLITSCSEYLKTHNLGNRGFGDGSPEEQLVGLIGECIVHHHLTGHFPDLSTKDEGFDGGFDFFYNGRKVDVKTMGRSGYVEDYYINNFYAVQLNHDSDVLVFCSYNTKERALEICGWITKAEMLSKAQFLPAGSYRRRTNGTVFALKQDNYEIPNYELNSIDTL